MTAHHSDSSQSEDLQNFGHHSIGHLSNAPIDLGYMAVNTGPVTKSEAVTPAPTLQRPHIGSEQGVNRNGGGPGFPVGHPQTQPVALPPARPRAVTSMVSQSTPSSQRIDPSPGQDSDMQENLSNLEPERTRIPLPPPQPPIRGFNNVPDQRVSVCTIPSAADTSSGLWQNIPHVYTSRQLLPPLDGTRSRTRHQPDDKVVWLVTFQARVFITCHPATHVDLQTYLTIIIYGVEDCFHRLPDLETRTRMHSLAVAGVPLAQLPVLNNARPLRQEVAWVQGGAALRTPDTFKELPCRDSRHYRTINTQYDQSQSESDEDEDEDDEDFAENVRVSRAAIPACRKCAKVAQAKLEAVGTMYISVVKSTQMQPGLDYQPPTAANVKNANHAINGASIYGVVKSGSRDAAATQAFYNAGARGLSTVFTCVVRADVDWRTVAQKGVRRVEGLWELVEETDGPVPIFF